jgi:hypothetical protein
LDYPTHRKSYVVITHCHNTKKNGEFIIYVNFLKLNLISKKTPYALPFTNEVLNTIVGQFIYFWSSLKIYITPKIKYKTTLVTDWGTFTWVVMPFGIKNGPPIYQ